MNVPALPNEANRFWQYSSSTTVSIHIAFIIQFHFSAAVKQKREAWSSAPCDRWYNLEGIRWKEPKSPINNLTGQSQKSCATEYNSTTEVGRVSVWNGVVWYASAQTSSVWNTLTPDHHTEQVASTSGQPRKEHMQRSHVSSSYSLIQFNRDVAVGQMK